MITMSHTCRSLIIIFLINCLGICVNGNEIIENVNKTVSVSNLKDFSIIEEDEANFDVKGVMLKNCDYY